MLAPSTMSVIRASWKPACGEDGAGRLQQRRRVSARIVSSGVDGRPASMTLSLRYPNHACPLSPAGAAPSGRAGSPRNVT